MTKKVISKLCTVTAMLFLACSCSTVGKDFKEENLSKLKNGVTSYDQVCRILAGKPIRHSYIKGGSVATWQYVSVNGLLLIPVTTDNKLVSIIFDEKDIMVKVNKLVNIDLPPSTRKRLTSTK